MWCGYVMLLSNYFGYEDRWLNHYSKTKCHLFSRPSEKIMLWFLESVLQSHSCFHFHVWNSSFLVAEHLLKVFPNWMDPRESHRPRDSHLAVTHWKKTTVIQILRTKDKPGESMSMRAMSRKLCRWKEVHLVSYKGRRQLTSRWHQFFVKSSRKLQFHNEKVQKVRPIAEWSRPSVARLNGDVISSLWGCSTMHSSWSFKIWKISF